MHIEFNELDNWCACTHMYGLTNYSVVKPDFPTLEYIVDSYLYEGYEHPVLMVTVNELETDVIEWLKKNKFKKGPQLRNWGHGGRKTQAWFYQIPRSVWLKKTGRTHLEW